MESTRDEVRRVLAVVIAKAIYQDLVKLDIDSYIDQIEEVYKVKISKGTMRKITQEEIDDISLQFKMDKVLNNYIPKGEC